MGEVKTENEIKKIIDKSKEKGKITVFTNGSFDMLHVRHIKFLQEAKKQGDILIVGVNSDDSVKRWKRHIKRDDWDKRPIISENDRAEMLAALGCVDYALIFDDLDPIRLIKKLRPNVHVNGSDYGKNCIEAKAVKKVGAKLKIIDSPGDSTSFIINKIIKLYGK